MSKTDLQHLNPWQFTEFCSKHNYRISIEYTNYSWGAGAKMLDDLSQRIPLALRDGNIPCYQGNIDRFISWLGKAHIPNSGYGATAVYRITK
jgi:hypothetical protein